MQNKELDEFVERVNEQTDIYSVISPYVQLTQKGGRYWGCCPFHNEKTASFSVSPDKGLFYCFGCQIGGNAFKFLSLIENITYFEAVKLQAQRLGIDLPKKKYSPEEERHRRLQEALFKVNSLAQDFYHERLIKKPHDSESRKYLESRGITSETIETFKLGWASEEWDELLTNFTRQGFPPEQLEKVGLIVRRKSSPGFYDRFRGRVMIPINDVLGHTVGFGGRTLKDSDVMNPKYLNSPETEIFNKRNLLFGLDKSTRAISTAGAAIVVEGYMDVISLFEAGIKNVVATLGTAFTPEHAKLILRYVRKIIFCYDNDEAGQRATLRALPIVQAAGANVFVIKVPDGKDPDEFIRKHGKEAFNELIKRAQPLIDYRLNYIFAHADITTTHGKLIALQEILPVVANVKNNVARSEYNKKISSALILDERLVGDELAKFSSCVQRKNAKERAPVVKNYNQKNQQSPIVQEACEIVLRMAWHDDDILDYVLMTLPREIFKETHREILERLEICKNEGRRLDEMSAIKELSPEANAELSKILMNGADDPRDTEVKIFTDSVNFLKQIILKKKYEMLLAQADEYVSGDRETYKDLIRKSLQIKLEMDKLRSISN